MYWSPETRLPLIANVMPLERFENLKRLFHMNDNLKMPKRGEVNFDRLYKVRPLLDCILESCRGIEQEEAHSIDDQIVLYKYTVIYFEIKSAPPEIKLRPKKHIISGPSEMELPTRKFKTFGEYQPL